MRPARGTLDAQDQVRLLAPQSSIRSGCSIRALREHMFAVPWKPRYSSEDARAAIEGAGSWREVLDALGLRYHGKSIRTVRRWAGRWRIPTAHLSNAVGPRSFVRRSDSDVAAAIAASRSWAEALRRLDYCPTGGNWKSLKARAAALDISVDHFDPKAALREANRRGRVPLEEILVEHSTYSRGKLKQRLYDADLKQRRCELCGQGEAWQGKPMGLILDHVNGIRDDHRLENLRIVCPNCAATLETHCGRKNRIQRDPIGCRRCGAPFIPRARTQRYCSRECGSRWDRRGRKRLGTRKVDRPPREQLISEVETEGYLATGRRYGVSDNAIRKWILEYERERAAAAGLNPDAVTIPTRTWPNRRR
jgi:hypothetical protein